MKIRLGWLIKPVARLGTWVFRRWMNTLDYVYHPLGEPVEPNDPKLPRRHLYAFWHETLLYPAFHYSVQGAQVLISRSEDGQIIAEVCRSLGFEPVRGSTSRGGVEAVRQILRAGQSTHVGVTPDGPRGPRRKVQAGVIYLAARTGLPIIPSGFAFARPWRLNSWDRFAVPRPWSRAVCVTLPPLQVPAELEKEDLETYRQKLEEALHQATALAEQLAASGTVATPGDHAPREAA